MTAKGSVRFSRRKTAVRLIISLWIVFHLFALVLGPNPQNYWGKTSGAVLEPYANFLGLVSTWSFFAPDPGPPPHYIEYEVYGKKQKILAEGEFPERKNPYFFQDRQNRRVTSARFMINQWERAEKMLVPYLCRKSAGAVRVRLWQVLHPIPTLWDVEQGKKIPNDPKDADRREISSTFCPDENEGIQK